MAIRSAMPWPVRWILVAVVLGFCAAIALWAFEFGKGIAGLDAGSRQELARLREEAAQLREERDKAQSVVNTSGSLLTAERAAREQLAQQMRQLEAENRALRDDLGFFEQLLPTGSSGGITIRALQAEAVPGGQLKWQVLVLQAQKNAAEFNGSLALTFAGSQGGKPWTMTAPMTELRVRQYRRLDGMVSLPPDTVVKTMSAQVLEGTVVRSVQSVKL